MVYYQNTRIGRMSLNFVGNKINQEPLVLSPFAVHPDAEQEAVLLPYLLDSFKSEIWFQLYHPSNLELNPVFEMVSKLFETPDLLEENAVEIARHLYDSATHPRIKGGELYTVYFEECLFNGDPCPAIGIFKAETKDTFFQIKNEDEKFKITSQSGSALGKLDKGCLIFNTGKPEGYFVRVFDQNTRGQEAQYWVDDFLGLHRKHDEYFETERTVQLCKDFITKRLPEFYEVDRVQQIDLLQRTKEYMDEQVEFKTQDYTEKIFADSEVIQHFEDYKREYEDAVGEVYSDDFNLSTPALKKSMSTFKGVIKLDKNFQIQILGDRSLIQKSQDEGGTFYKLYFEQES